MIAVMVSSRRSTSPLAVVSKIWLTSVSNCDHTAWLLAGGHLIRFCWTTLQGFEGYAAWRDWTLWGDSGLGSCCVSPRSDPVRCNTSSCSLHFILAKCILRPRGFLHTFLQMHLAFVVVFPFAWVNTVGSVRLGLSFSPPLGLPWGCFSVGRSVACLGLSLAEDAGWAATPSCPGCRLSVLSTVSPVVTKLSWSSPSLFLGVTGQASGMKRKYIFDYNVTKHRIIPKLKENSKSIRALHCTHTEKQIM